MKYCFYVVVKVSLMFEREDSSCSSECYAEIILSVQTLDVMMKMCRAVLL